LDTVKPDDNVIVAGVVRAKTMSSDAVVALASSTACRSDPAPLSLVLLTVNVAANSGAQARIIKMIRQRIAHLLGNCRRSSAPEGFSGPAPNVVGKTLAVSRTAPQV
jgi:hypothetical protein